jgi:hypothetical protein
VLQTPTTFPVRYGSYALLKLLSAQGEEPVYLAAISGAKELRVIKTVALQDRGVVDLGFLKGETKKLSQMHSANLAAVLASPEVESDGGFAMEYVPGKSLAAIGKRAEEYAVLLPPELGLVVAHDAFAAAEDFHLFEGAGRVHGNISQRTILVSYSGRAKVAGYRPGSHATVGPDMHLARDLKPLAALLCDLPFQMFPKELTQFVPRLLEDNISPVEAIAATRAFLHEHVPSAEHRKKVADWLEDLFPDHQCDRETQEEARLLATGRQLLAPSALRSVSRPLSVFGGTTALLALVGAGVLLVAHRGPGQAFSKARHVETTPAVVLVPELPIAQPTPEPPAPTPAPTPKATILDDQAGTVTASLDAPKPQPSMPGNRPTRPRSEAASAEHLLHEADAAFGVGKRIEAVNMGIQALNAGGGLRAHLALGEYYRSLHRYQDALNHYRAAAEVEPENKLAVAGVNLLEKKLSPCQ